MAKSIKKNLLYQSAYQVLMVISPLITSPYLARTLGNEKYGTYSFYYSVAYYFGIFTILGMANYGNRTIAQVKVSGKEKISQTFAELVTMQISMLALISVVYLLSLPLWAGDYYINALIEWLYILSVGLDISWFYFGLEEFKLTTIRSFIVKIGIVASILLFVKTPKDLNVYTFIMAGGTLLGSLLLWAQLPKYVSFRRVKVCDIVKHIKPNITLFVPVVSLALFHYTDKIMLGAMSTMSELGYYTNADKVVNIPMGLIAGLGTVMLPRISALKSSNESKTIIKYINASLIISLWAGCAMCFGILAISRDFVPFFFGSGYERCISLLEWLCLVVIIKALSNVFRTQFLIPMNKDKEFNISVIVAAVVNIIFNSLLIPEYGALGAVFGTLIAELLVLILYAFYSRQVILFKKIFFPLIIFTLSGIIMKFCVDYIAYALAVESLFVKLVCEVLAGALIYCALTSGVLLRLRRNL